MYILMIDMYTYARFYLFRGATELCYFEIYSK
jgi:hypothetical protein